MEYLPGSFIWRYVSSSERSSLTKTAYVYRVWGRCFNAVENAEDQESQAYYMVGELEKRSARTPELEKAGNSIGGFTFQFSDGWWKFGFDDRKMQMCMTITLPGLTAVTSETMSGRKQYERRVVWDLRQRTNQRARFIYLYPRAAYYALKEAHQLNPYAPGRRSRRSILISIISSSSMRYSEREGQSRFGK